VRKIPVVRVLDDSEFVLLSGLCGILSVLTGIWRSRLAKSVLWGLFRLTSAWC